MEDWNIFCWPIFVAFRIVFCCSALTIRINSRKAVSCMSMENCIIIFWISISSVTFDENVYLLLVLSVLIGSLIKIESFAVHFGRRQHIKYSFGSFTSDFKIFQSSIWKSTTNMIIDICLLKYVPVTPSRMSITSFERVSHTFQINRNKTMKKAHCSKIML